jgi:hypothetical protein
LFCRFLNEDEKVAEIRRERKQINAPQKVKENQVKENQVKEKKIEKSKEDTEGEAKQVFPEGFQDKESSTGTSISR